MLQSGSDPKNFQSIAQFQASLPSLVGSQLVEIFYIQPCQVDGVFFSSEAICYLYLGTSMSEKPLFPESFMEAPAVHSMSTLPRFT